MNIEPGLPPIATVSQKDGRTRTTIRGLEPDDPTATTVGGDVRLFISQALERFNLADSDENYSRLEGLTDVLMVDGEGQWDSTIRGMRERKGRPCITINRLQPMLQHVTNEQRMSRPSIQVEPVAGGADPDSAQIRQGIIRHVEVRSHAKTVYDTAFERMLEKGWSWFRIVTEFESERSQNQTLRIEGFVNDFCVYWDPDAQDPTRKDMKWAFVVYDMPRGEYLTRWPKSKAAGLSNFSSFGDDAPGWFQSDSIRVAEYYYIKEVPEKLFYMADGSESKFESELDGTEYLAFDANGLPAGRMSARSSVNWGLINAVEVLEGNHGDDIEANTEGRKIAGKYIPLIMLTGRERIVNGQRRLSGMVRNAREPQRIYNYLTTAFVEMIALAPKSPFIAAAGQIEKYKKIWETANTENWPYLPYDPMTVDGQNVPPPQRTEFNPQVLALAQGIREFDNDLKLIFNIFDASLGTAKPDQSGRAVVALQQRSDSGNMNWLDNSRRSLEHAGDVMLCQIPEVFDAPRIQTIVRPDNQRQQILINQEFDEILPAPEGQKKPYYMQTGEYSCSVSIGEYASKRQKAVASLSELAKNVPEAALGLLPLIIENMDTPFAAEALAIVKRLQPPQLQEPGSPEQMQQQFMMLMQQHEELVQALEAANHTIETKEVEADSREFITGLQVQAQVAIAAAKLGSVEGVQALTQEYKRITDMWNAHQDTFMLREQHAHEKEIQKMLPKPAAQ